MYVYDLSSWCWKKLWASLKFIFAHFPHQILWCLCPGTTKAFWTFFYPEGSNFRFSGFFWALKPLLVTWYLDQAFFQVPGLKYTQQGQNCDLVTFFQIEGCYEKLSKCNISHKIVHLGHAFDLVNKFDKFYFQKKCSQYFFSSKNILGNHNVPGQQNTYIIIFSDQNTFLSSPSSFFILP